MQYPPPICINILPAHSLIEVSPDKKGLVGTTTEIYLPPGEFLESDEPNTLYVNENEIGIVLEDGEKEIVGDGVGAGFKPAPTGDDYYLTIKYIFNTDKLYFYNHGEKIGSISLRGKEFNIHEMVEDLRSKCHPERTTSSMSLRGALATKQSPLFISSPSKGDPSSPQNVAPQDDKPIAFLKTYPKPLTSKRIKCFMEGHMRK